ncbi:hypothetical protein D3C77_629240 [compost metagenome]
MVLGNANNGAYDRTVDAAMEQQGLVALAFDQEHTGPRQASFVGSHYIGSPRARRHHSQDQVVLDEAWWPVFGQLAKPAFIDKQADSGSCLGIGYPQANGLVQLTEPWHLLEGIGVGFAYQCNPASRALLFYSTDD